MTSAKPATVRLYFDADVLGLAKLLGQVRADFTYPSDPGARIKRFERPPCPIASPGEKDPVWIPTVARFGWLIVTRDHNIQRNTAEIDAVRDNGAKMVCFAGREALDKWAQLEIFMTRWRDIEPLVDLPGPFIYTLTRTGALNSLDLRP